MKALLLSLCLCGLLAQTTQSQAWTLPSWNEALDTFTNYIQSWKSEEKPSEGDAEDDDKEESICLGDACKEETHEETQEEDIASLFHFEELPTLDPSIKLLPENHNVFSHSDADLLKQLEGVFLANAQTGINFFISLHRADAARAATLFVSKNFSDDFRFALLHDTPAPYAAMLLHNLRQNLKGKEFYQRGDFEFTNDHYGSMKADYALISGSLVPAQYLPFILLHNLSESDPEVATKYQARVDRIGEILFSMEKEQLLALFIYQPEEAIIKIGKKNRNYCLGQVKKQDLCDLPMEGGIHKEFVIAAFVGIAEKHTDVIAKVIEHEYTHFPKRGAFIIKNTPGNILKDALSHMTNMEVRKAIAQLRPEVTQESIEDLIGSLTNLLGDGSADSEDSSDNVLQIGQSENEEINQDNDNIIL